MITINDAVDYEAQSSPWIKFISWGPLQTLAARYLAAKVKRKHARYARGMADRAFFLMSRSELNCYTQEIITIANDFHGDRITQQEMYYRMQRAVASRYAK